MNDAQQRSPWYTMAEYIAETRQGKPGIQGRGRPRYVGIIVRRRATLLPVAIRDMLIGAGCTAVTVYANPEEAAVLLQPGHGKSGENIFPVGPRIGAAAGSVAPTGHYGYRGTIVAAGCSSENNGRSSAP
jgi:hypothetical protein